MLFRSQLKPDSTILPQDFGGKFAEHARTFLDEGYRVIVPDLPSHGRSTGIHVHLPDLDLLGALRSRS